MPAMNRLSNYATTIASRNGNTLITYHSTVIVEFDPDCVILRTGGYATVTTKRKMNQAARQFDLPYSVIQRDFDWFVVTATGEYPFNDREFVLDRRTLAPYVAA